MKEVMDAIKQNGNARASTSCRIMKEDKAKGIKTMDNMMDICSVTWSLIGSLSDGYLASREVTNEEYQEKKKILRNKMSLKSYQI